MDIENSFPAINMKIPTIPAKTILQTSKTNGWFGCSYTVNLYRGCIHNCVYCDSRSHCYHIENFEEVAVKGEGLSLLEAELARKKKRGVIATGAMSDPYNPFENTLKYTRKFLEIAHKYQFGVAVATKGDLIKRDIDLLSDIGVHSPVLAKFTITCASDALAAKLEPGAPSSSRRFGALRALARAGIFSGILLMPVMPFINDTAENISSVVRLAADSGARFIYPSFGVTMRTGQREYCLRALDAAFPEEKYSQKYQEMFGERYYCASPASEALWELFAEECEKFDILYKMQDIITAYQADGTSRGQLSFL